MLQVSATQEAYGKKEKDHSIFTYHLLEGLRGANGASIDKDGYVTPSSLGDYVYHRVTASAVKQKPVIKTETAGRIILANYPNLVRKTFVPQQLPQQGNALTDHLISEIMSSQYNALTKDPSYSPALDSRGMSRTVFISYAREDAEHADRLYNDLKAGGLIPQRDKDAILPGYNWEIAIRKTIKNSQFFIPLFSSNSVDKIGYVQKELKYVIDNFDEFPESQIYVIPARLDNCQISYRKLEDIQYIDLFPDWDKGIGQIFEAIGIKPVPAD